MLDWSRAKTVVTGGAGFLGQIVCDVLARRGCEQVVVPLHADYDLTREADVARMYRDCAPDVVIHLAAEVGGIGANMRHPGRFFFANMAMGLHLIEHARQVGLKKFVQVGTVCAYPKFAPVPFREDDVWNGYPEETNAPYGVAKKALFVMLDAYRAQYDFPGIALIPVNLYGPDDNFDAETSHVIPALIRKCCDAVATGTPEVVIWGTGSVSREFLYVDDAARGIVAATREYDDPAPVNLGSGREIRISELATMIAERTGFTGRLVWDQREPDGQPRRCLDTSRAARAFGFRAETSFEAGLRSTIAWYREHRAQEHAHPNRGGHATLRPVTTDP